ncbi:MAG: DUF1064 domain-containing protein [Acidobacteria bacterium]|nr:DUF1064 domain-containing protein [Acidobacteriota bacterium]
MRKPRRGKSNASKTAYNGRVYASRLEADYASHLDMLKKIGEVAEWYPQQPRLDLVVNGVKVGYYTPDFEIHSPDGSVVLVDTKGFVPQGWPFRLKVIRACHPNVDLRIVRREDF